MIAEVQVEGGATFRPGTNVIVENIPAWYEYDASPELIAVIKVAYTARGRPLTAKEFMEIADRFK